VSPLARRATQGTEVRSTGRLVERALSLLAAGPVSTGRLAEEVLALRGNPSAAAAAVFALLGDEPLARVDATGAWSLVAPAPAAPHFAEQRWTVVDVETTGGSPDRGDRVIEIGIVILDGGRISETWSSLVDPSRRVPGMITSLTGISNQMLVGAPRFDEIAPRVASVLQRGVFVAHNASFDWRFVSSELERTTGSRLDGRNLCTLRLARRLLPHLPSRSLGSLASYFGIEMESHHRALDDARATAVLLLRLLESLEERGVTDWAGLERWFAPPSSRRKRSALPRSVDSA